MISHHFVGTGRCSERLRSAEPAQLLALVTERVVDCGLGVVVEQAVPFDNGGLTLVLWNRINRYYLAALLYSCFAGRSAGGRRRRLFSRQRKHL